MLDKIAHEAAVIVDHRVVVVVFNRHELVDYLLDGDFADLFEEVDFFQDDGGCIESKAGLCSPKVLQSKLCFLKYYMECHFVTVDYPDL